MKRFCICYTRARDNLLERVGAARDVRVATRIAMSRQDDSRGSGTLSPLVGPRI
jgi:hypothetical protein